MAWVAAVLGSFTFVALIQLMVVVMGDAGRLVAVVLLILQLAAAGGIYPVELSGQFYMAIHPYLPLTALVRAFRATMFGAFGGTWSEAAVQLAVTGCVPAVLAIWLARWKYVSRERTVRRWNSRERRSKDLILCAHCALKTAARWTI